MNTPGAETVTGSVVGDSYPDLVREFRLRPIHSDSELDAAIAMVDALLDRESLDAGAQDYLDVLAQLIHTYESTEQPIALASDADVLRHLIDANGISQKDLAASTAISESVVSEILSGKRELNREQVESVCHTFGVKSSLFFSK
ncbi:MAG: helix-turn-helix domain-containing protein [Planctomycetota bacterium]|nr:MAG: helix-turn-helix domain-containing protein [Planctomycetota bacterium]REJ90998.1 MAG: helix-turn-helix domain-containing protein [Planctomycetota bacterium]REK31043.1 MAG: helix-turn-helix domain-containing protein [Planctomycetota bacterium]REK36841.1 MAG: helix-turn-helix domain-containing protein [Planctomycetota bacterium]